MVELYWIEFDWIGLIPMHFLAISSAVATRSVCSKSSQKNPSYDLKTSSGTVIFDYNVFVVVVAVFLCDIFCDLN